MGDMQKRFNVKNKKTGIREIMRDGKCILEVIV